MEHHPLRRAAMVVSSLEPAAADALLERLPEEQAAAIRMELMGLSAESDQEQQDVLREFLHPPQPLPPSHAVASCPGTVEDGAAGSPALEDLLQLDNQAIVMALMHERAALVAGMLAAIPGQRAAMVLRMLPEPLQARVMVLLGHGVAPRESIIDAVADAICTRHAGATGESSVGLRHRDALQDILDAMGPQERLEMLRSLAAENPLLAQRMAESSGHLNDCYC